MGLSKQRARNTAPAWVPPLVVSVAGKMRGFSREIVDRLLIDTKMETVWREIGQHAVKPLQADMDCNLRVNHWLGRDVEASPKDEAAVAFFACVVIQARLGNKARERGDLYALASRFADAAEMARIARLDPFASPPGGVDVDALAKAEVILKAIAANTKRQATGHPLVVDRIMDRDNRDGARAIVRSIAIVTRSIFRQCVRGTIATATSVAMNTQITLRSAVNWCEGL
jgi:hypothetical protein